MSGRGGIGSLVKYEVMDRAAVITVDNPAKCQALSDDVYEGLFKALDMAEHDHLVRAIVLTASGNKHFIVGADITGFPLDLDTGRQWLRRSQKLFHRVETICKPVIAAVNGMALGGGMELTLYCDMVVAREGVEFGLPEAALGIVPAYALLRLHQIVGRHKAAELMMTCNRISAEEGLRLGLINYIVPADRLLDTAHQLVNRLSKQPALSIEVIKSAVYRGLGEADYPYMIDAVSQFFSTEELATRVNTFRGRTTAQH